MSYWVSFSGWDKLTNIQWHLIEFCAKKSMNKFPPILNLNSVWGQMFSKSYELDMSGAEVQLWGQDRAAECAGWCGQHEAICDVCPVNN